MRKRIDIMTDIETLGTQEDVAIIQLSAIAFDIDSGEIIDTFDEYVDIENMKALIIDGSTLKWWLKDEKRDVLSDILKNGSKNLKRTLLEFEKWIKNLECDNKEKYLWGNGILFDNRIIQESMHKYDITYPIFYRNDRDVRTIVELASKRTEKTLDEIKDMIPSVGVKHNAINDTKYQIDLVRWCYDVLIKSV